MKTHDELARLIELERGVAPPADAAQRSWRALEYMRASGAEPLAVASGSVLKLGASSLLAKVVGSAIVASTIATAGVGVYAVSTRPATAHDVAPPPSALAPAAVAFSAQPLPAPSAREHPSPAPERSARTPVALSVPASPKSTFDAELVLMERAKSALNGGRPHMADVWLDEHQAKYPRGVFAGEREGLRVVLLCRTGRIEEGRQRAARLGRSVLNDHIGRACHMNGTEPGNEADK